MCSEKETKKLQECINYFKKNTGYDRIFRAMRSKWKTYGKVAGVILIKDATAEECQALQRIMGKAYEGNLLKFRMEDFQKAIDESRFGGMTLKMLLSAYFHDDLVTNKSECMVREEERQKFWLDIISAAGKEAHEAKQWLSTMREKKICGYQIVMSVYRNDRESARVILLQVCKALSIVGQRQREEGRLRLAVLSSQVTGNPHCFDRNREEGKLLLNALAYRNECEYPQNAEKALELYYAAGISPDDVSSFSTAYGIHLYTAEGIHGAYEIFIDAGEPYVVTLSNLNRIVKADCLEKKVYIVENQMVFSQICEDLNGKAVGLVCTSGQVKTASLILIDLLCRSGCHLFYSGDLDPEGICIADRLISRHPGQITAWHMSENDYNLSVSDEDINEVRLKKLETIKNIELIPAAQKVLSKKKSGYQEQLLELLEGDMKRG